jgi:hypothetical protein
MALLNAVMAQWYKCTVPSELGFRLKVIQRHRSIDHALFGSTAYIAPASGKSRPPGGVSFANLARKISNNHYQLLLRLEVSK